VLSRRGSAVSKRRTFPKDYFYMARSALLNVMVQAAFKAGKSLARDFGEVQNLQVSLKGPGDYVSQADRKAEKLIREDLMKARPTYGFLGEESEEIAGTDGAHRWIVDPLDGTTNFLHGIPVFSISIALERQGQLVAGVVYNPAMDELYTAERGGGAFMNDRRLRVAARRNLSDAVISTGVPHLGRGHHGQALVELKNVMGEAAGIRRLGSAALDLAWVAAGRVDGYWENWLAPWDLAAGILLVREAGGFCSDGSGGQAMFDSGTIVAGNEPIHKALLATLRKKA
jgi:myo-inositol-1(or 4)-monophosphatase